MIRVPFSSLRARLILLVLLATLPAFGLILYSASEQRRAAATEVQQQALRLARLAAAAQQDLVDAARELLVVLAQLPQIRGGTPAQCEALLANLLKQSPGYTNLGVANRNGDSICSALAVPTPVNFADREWFRRAMETRGFVIGDYSFGRISGKTALGLGYPILDSAGEVQVVLFASLDLVWLGKLAAQTQIPPGGTLTVVDRNGTVLVHSPNPGGWVGRSAAETPIGKAMQSQGEGVVDAPGIDGVRRLHAFAPLTGGREAGASVGIGIPLEAAYAAADRSLRRNLAGLGLVGGLALLAAWIGTDLFILRRVRALVAATGRLAAGDLSARTGLSYGVGELSQLSRAFDKMAESLENRQREARRAQEALRQSESRYRELVENGLGLICTHDHEGTVLSVNTAAADLLGYRPADMVGKNMGDFLPPSEHGRFAEYLRRLREEESIGGLMRVLTRDGEERFWVYRSRRFEEEGKQPYVVGHAQDITERRQAEEALGQSEERFRLLAENAQDIIYRYRLKPSRGFEYVSPAATTITGYTPEEHYADPDLGLKLVHPEDRHLLEDLLARRASDLPLELRWVRKDGRVIWTEQRNVPIYAPDGIPIAIEGIARDISERKRAEEALRESERKLQAQYKELEQLYKTAPVGLCLVDHEMRFVRINERLAAINGKPVEDHIGRRPRDLIPEIAAEVESIFRRVIHFGEPVLDLEIHGMTPAEPGVERHWLASYYPVKSDDGAVHGVNAVVLEITERKQAEETLRESEERFRALAEAAPIGIFLTKPTGECIYTNPLWSAISGLGSEESLGYGWTRAIHPDDREKVKESWLAAAARGENYAADYRVITPAGNLRWVHALATPQVDASESIVNYIGSVEDVTDRKRAEEELRARARQQAAVAELGQRALAATDLGPLMDEAVELIATTLDVEYVEVLEVLPDGSAFRLRVGVGWRDGLVGTVTVPAAIESQAGYTFLLKGPVIVQDLRTETRFTAPSLLHDHGVVSGMSVNIAGPEKPFGVLGVHTREARTFSEDDVHFLQAVANVLAQAVARQSAEEALRRSEKLAAMGELLAGVAHELNNPLSVIVGQTELLRRTVRAGALAERLHKVAQAADRCARIVKNFLALAHPHAAERRRIGLNQVIQEAVDLLGYELRVDNVEVVLTLALDLPVLWGDPHQLQQVVVNVITNAHQAMRETPGARRLTLTTRFQPDAARVLLEVRDTGPGIPPEIRSRIFEPFFTTKPPGRGTGLGLSLCQGIVEGHGGTIQVESEAGHGTVFRIELPVETPPDPKPGPKEPQTLPRIRGKSILVVDDEPGVAGVLVDLLFRDAHRVDTAPNGLVALTRLNSASYDLIVSDIRMPELDGPAFYQEVVRRYPKLSRRIIFITGDSLSPETRQFLDETGAPNLNKPFVLEEIREVVQQTLRAPVIL